MLTLYEDGSFELCEPSPTWFAGTAAEAEMKVLRERLSRTDWCRSTDDVLPRDRFDMLELCGKPILVTPGGGRSDLLEVVATLNAMARRATPSSERGPCNASR